MYQKKECRSSKKAETAGTSAKSGTPAIAKMPATARMPAIETTAATRIATTRMSSIAGRPTNLIYLNSFLMSGKTNRKAGTSVETNHICQRSLLANFPCQPLLQRLYLLQEYININKNGCLCIDRGHRTDSAIIWYKKQHNCTYYLTKDTLTEATYWAPHPLSLGTSPI
jgi:hypothetical protein